MSAVKSGRVLLDNLAVDRDFTNLAGIVDLHADRVVAVESEGLERRRRVQNVNVGRGDVRS